MGRHETATTSELGKMHVAPPARPDGAGAERLVAAAGRALAAAEEELRALERLHAAVVRRAMAAELSPWLEPGTPCDVCGSDVHPSPARAAPDLEATRRALAAAEQLAASCLAVVASMGRREGRPMSDNTDADGPTLH